MAWLSGWGKRIELEIGDYAGDIGAEVTWFPATIFLKDANGDSTKVFLEITTNSRKIAITKSDGETELKGEIEDWSYDAGTPANSTAIIHTSADGWVINANTSIFLYYDNTHTVNANIDVVNTVAGAAVWDGDFVAVYHMVDDNGNVDDSTSNDNDGTKLGAGEPAEAAGKIGQGQSFDGSNDMITTFDPSAELGNNVTMEAVVYADTLSNFKGVMADYAPPKGFKGFQYEGGPLIFAYFDGSTGYENNNLTISTETWTYISGVIKAEASGYVKVYKDGAEQGSQVNASTSISHQSTFPIGRSYNTAGRYWDGIIDEVRVSNTNRSAAWILGTYNSLWDTLFTYGSEEEEPVVAAISTLVIGGNF